MADAGSAQQEADALVVGAGLAGAVAALRLREAGLAVRVVADGGGATELSTGALGLVPRLAPDDLRWLLHVLPGAFTAREDGAPMRVATAAGRIVDVAAAPIQTLDLRSVPEGRIAVVGADLSGAPDLDGLVKLLETAGGGTSRFVAVRVPLLPHDELALLSPGSAAGRLAAEPALAGELLRKAVSGTREAVARAILAPSWAPATALRRAAEESGMPVGRMLGTYGGAPGGRELSAAIRAALEGAGVEVLEERVKELRREGDSWAAFGESGPLVRARVAIVATGGAAGGGLLKRGRIFAEPGVGGRLVFGRETLRQEAAPLGPGADAFLPARLFGEGGPRSVRVAVDERMRPEGAEDGLYLAGELAGGEGAEVSEGGEEGRERGEGGLAWAVVSGLRAGGEGAEGRGGRGDPTDR